MAKITIVTCEYRGQTFKGKVLSSTNCPIRKGQPYDMGTKTYEVDIPENWYVEMEHVEGSARKVGSYDYFKQHEDGVKNVKFEEVEEVA